MEFIRLESIHKTYERGVISVPVLKGVSLSIRQARDGCAHGGFGFGQDDVDQPPGVPRPPVQRPILALTARRSRGWVRRSEPGCEAGRSGSSFRTSTSCRE